MKLPIPCNVITGALGSGKTSVILNLLQQKPPNEKWAVLVNDFGGLDSAALKDCAASVADGVVVRELAGGCLCCSLSGPMTAAIAMLVRQAQPSRLIIEPSGVGHPAGLLATLQGPHLGSALRLMGPICVVDVRLASTNQFMSSTTLQDQVAVAAVLVGNRWEEASGAAQAAFTAWAAGLYPPKLALAKGAGSLAAAQHLDTPYGPGVFVPMFAPAPGRPLRLASSSLALEPAGTASASSAPQLRSWQPGPGPHGGQANFTGEAPSAADSGTVLQVAAPGAVVRYEAETSEAASVGWLFGSDARFSLEPLGHFLEALAPHVLRLKGVFRQSSSRWVAPQWAAAASEAAELAEDAGCLGAQGGHTRTAAAHPVLLWVEVPGGAWSDSRLEIVVDRKASGSRALSQHRKAAPAHSFNADGTGDEAAAMPEWTVAEALAAARAAQWNGLEEFILQKLIIRSSVAT